MFRSSSRFARNGWQYKLARSLGTVENYRYNNICKVSNFNTATEQRSQADRAIGKAAQQFRGFRREHRYLGIMEDSRRIQSSYT